MNLAAHSAVPFASRICITAATRPSSLSITPGFTFRPSANNATLTTFPTPFRNGDFSPILGPQLTVDGAPVFDPEGRPVYQGAIYDPFSVHNVIGPDGNTYAVRDPFPGNMIPSGFPGLSKVSQTILQELSL